MSREVVTALPGWASRAAAALEEARERTLSLVRGLSDDALRRQHSPLMSPVVRDLGHVANYEEQWLVRALGAPPVATGEIDTLFDAVRHPRSTRERLALPSPAAAFEYLAAVRARTLEWLERISAGRAQVPSTTAEGLVREGFVWGMVAQHEHQHGETLCATLQLMTDPPWSAPEDPPFARPNPQREVDPRAEVFVPAGACRIGTRSDPWAYDNERGEHEVEVPAFYLDRHPVTCGRYLEFIEDGGYRRRELWSEEGWAHVQREGLTAPLFWERSARSGSGASGRWVRRRFGTVEPIPLDEPVMHVCWYEAAAFARWSGRRLPTELEWEKAASWVPRTGARRGAKPGLPSARRVRALRVRPARGQRARDRAATRLRTAAGASSRPRCSPRSLR